MDKQFRTITAHHNGNIILTLYWMYSDFAISSNKEIISLPMKTEENRIIPDSDTVYLEDTTGKRYKRHFDNLSTRNIYRYKLI